MTKLSLLLAGLLGAATLSVQAGELYPSPQYQDAPTGLTRAEVRQTVTQRHQAGAAYHNDIDLPGNGTAAGDVRPFGRTRASVRSDVQEARANGGLEHNDVDLPDVARGAQTTREQVRAEAIAARQSVRTAPGRNTVEY